MKYLKLLLPFSTLLILAAACQPSEESNLSLLSSRIPTDSALVFAPGVISSNHFEFAITFSPEMDELFFTRRKPNKDNEIFTSELVNGKWSEPKIAFFTTDNGWDFEPHISPKGDLLYFGSTRPLSDTAKSSGMHQWYSQKTSNGWGQPIPLDKPFVDRFAMYITSSQTGNLYFTSGDEGAKPEDGGIYYALRTNGQYKAVTSMRDEIDFPGQWVAHPYIAPDESFMIYDSERVNGFGDCDLYITFNQEGHWTEPANMGPSVNTEQCEMCASVSPDGKFLFFHRGVYNNGDGDIGNIHWIDFIRTKGRIESSISD